MKFIFVILAVSVMSLTAHSGAPGTKGDMVPWPWGSECPFPWSGVEGTWRVDPVSQSEFAGYALEFHHYKEGAKKVLAARIFNASGEVLAVGHGFSINGGEVILLTMKNISTESRFRIYVRVYPEHGGLSCSDRSRQVMVAAFCSPRGRKCLNDSNYILSRISPN